jgi:hypothetical protein
VLTPDREKSQTGRAGYPAAIRRGADLRILSFANPASADSGCFRAKRPCSDKIAFDLFYNFAYQALCAVMARADSHQDTFMEDTESNG